MKPTITPKSSPTCSFCGEPPHDMADCPACWDADKTRAELIAQRKINRYNAEDWAEAHDHLQALCRAAGCTESMVEDGGSDGFPTITELASLLYNKLSGSSSGPFFLFSGIACYPYGGFADFKSAHTTPEGAVKAAEATRKNERIDWFEVIDVRTGKRVYGYGDSCYYDYAENVSL